MKIVDLLKQRDFKSFFSRSWSVSWPMSLIMFFEFLIGLTDVYIAGKIGKEVQATYGFAAQLYFIFIIFANALTVGTVAVVSQLFASGDKKDLNRAIFSSILASIFAGACLSLGGVFLTGSLIHLLNIPEELKPIAVPMMKFYAVGLLFHYVLINSNGILRSCQRIRDSLKTMVLVCGINILLNLYFLHHTDLGSRGIALSTAASVAIGCLLNLIRLRRLASWQPTLSVRLIHRMFHIGWPIGLLQILWQLASMVLFLILSSLPVNRIEILAAFSTGLRIESAIFLPAYAFNLANAVIIGNLIGEGRKEEAFQNGMVTALIGVGLITGMVIAVVLNARWIVSLLSDNPIVIEEAKTYLYISMLSEPAMAWGVILAGGLNGAGDTRSVLIRIALGVWLVRIPLVYLFVVSLGYGAVSAWWAMNLSQGVQVLLISRRYLSRGWLSK